MSCSREVAISNNGLIAGGAGGTGTDQSMVPIQSTCQSRMNVAIVRIKAIDATRICRTSNAISVQLIDMILRAKINVPREPSVPGSSGT